MAGGKTGLSVVVCSKSAQVPGSFARNIRETIGPVEYEIVWIDNSRNEYSIFAAYNQGISLARYDVVCFMHDDVKMLSGNWGEICLKMLEDAQVGLLGLIGTHYLSPFSVYWLSSGINHGRIMQGFEKKGVHCTEEWNWNKHDKYGSRVVAIDGIWMCCPKSVFDGGIRFDEDTYDGFHFYDMDLSMQIVQSGRTILVADDILAEHTTQSRYNHSFLESCKCFHRKWNDLLPVMSSAIAEEDIRQFEINTVANACNATLVNDELRVLTRHPLHRFVQKTLVLWRSFLGKASN